MTVTADLESIYWRQVFFSTCIKSNRPRWSRLCPRSLAFLSFFNAFTSLLFIQKVECQMFYIEAENATQFYVLTEHIWHFQIFTVTLGWKKKKTIFGGFQSSVLSLVLVLFYFRPMREDSCMEKCSLIYFEMFFFFNLFNNATIKGNKIKNNWLKSETKNWQVFFYYLKTKNAIHF